MPPICFLVEDDSIADAAVKHITSEAGLLQHAGDQTLVHLRFSSSHLSYPTITERALHVCRQAKGFPKWQVLHLSEADVLRAIQLCMGERAKQECGEFCVQVSDVMAVHQRLNNNAIYGERCPSDGDGDTAAYRRYLADNHLVDSPAVLQRLQRLAELGACPPRRPLLIHGTPGSLLERRMAAVLCGEQVVAVTRQGGEAQLNMVQTVWHCVDVEPPAATHQSPTDAHIANMFSALFRLLVNSRDELALAAACQAPGLELTGHDFLSIRRTARARALPMYQTVVSHVRRVELGGRNYQPAADCPLHACTPPLRALVDLVHKLHTVLEEEADPSKCCVRLLSAMKSCVMRGTRLRPAAVERAAGELRTTIQAVAADYGADSDTDVLGGPAVKMVRDLCDRMSCSGLPVTDHLSVLDDTVASPCTPGRSPATLPSVVSLFRTPTEVDENSNDGASLTLEERLSKKGISRTETPTTSKRFGASLDWLPAPDGPAGGASPPLDEPTPPLVAGPTLVCSRSGTKYAAGAGVRAFRELQASDRARQKDNKMLSPTTSKLRKQPKQPRSLFDATNSAKCEAPKTAKRRKTEASQDHENMPVSDSSSKSQQNSHQLKAQPTVPKKPKTKQIKQVNGQKSIRDFFRI